MKDEWLASLLLACLVLIGIAVGIGLCGMVLVVEAAKSVIESGGVVLALASSFVNEAVILVAGTALATSPQLGLRFGGLPVLGGALTRVFGR